MLRQYTDDQLLFASGLVVILAATIFVMPGFPGVSEQPQKNVLPHYVVNPDPEVVTELGTSDPFVLGQYYFNQGGYQNEHYDREKAKQYYLQAVHEDVKFMNPMVRYQLGRTFFIGGEFNEAIQVFGVQIDAFGNEVLAVHYTLGLTHAYKALETNDVDDWSAAEQSFRNYIAVDPQNPWARVDLSWILFSQGKFEAMLTELEAVLPEHADNPWVQNMYGLALLNTARFDEAVVSFNEAKKYLALLTPLDWGQSYPGNNPADWAQGLDEFRTAVDANLTLAVTQQSTE